jgi:hypothetical protein
MYNNRRRILMLGNHHSKNSKSRFQERENKGLELVIIFFSNVLCKFQFLLLTLTSLLSTLELFLMSIRWEPQGLHSFIMSIEAKCNARMECLLRLLQN